jgi:hypothetical protein
MAPGLLEGTGEFCPLSELESPLTRLLMITPGILGFSKRVEVERCFEIVVGQQVSKLSTGDDMSSLQIAASRSRSSKVVPAVGRMFIRSCASTGSVSHVFGYGTSSRISKGPFWSYFRVRSTVA